LSGLQPPRYIADSSEVPQWLKPALFLAIYAGLKGLLHPFGFRKHKARGYMPIGFYPKD
jgi:hypothetical protein